MKKFLFALIIILLLSSCRERNDIKNTIAVIDPDSIKNRINEMCAFETRFFLADNEHEIAMYLADILKSSGMDSVIIDSFTNTVEFPLKSGIFVTDTHYNVYGLMIASETEHGETGVIGAHYDSYNADTDPLVFSPGADNNASGTACLLEILRVLKSEDIKVSHNLLFAFFGSEEFMTMFTQGKSGAEHFVSETDRNIVYMIDCNQIGYNPDNMLLQLDFQICPRSQRLSSLMIDACTTYTDIRPVLTGDHINYSDVFYFWNNNIASILFEEYFFSPNNFTSHDIADSLNYDLIAETARFILAGLLMINTAQ